MKLLFALFLLIFMPGIANAACTDGAADFFQCAFGKPPAEHQMPDSDKLCRGRVSLDGGAITGCIAGCG
ncbi:hypothetical protein RAD15_08705 [Bradyrhizobium sp. 14AA]